MPAMLKDFLLLMSIITLRIDSIILPGRTGPLSLVDVMACLTVQDLYLQSIHEYDLARLYETLTFDEYDLAQPYETLSSKHI